MSRYLLDVNVLLSIAWEDLEDHEKVLGWFESLGQQSFASCGITQSGFIRISLNASFRPQVVPIGAAMELLATLTSNPGHTFWPLDIGIGKATKFCIDRLSGSRQITDAYLLGLAIANDGVLVTLDQAIPRLAGKAFASHVLLLK